MSMVAMKVLSRAILGKRKDRSEFAEEKQGKAAAEVRDSATEVEDADAEVEDDAAEVEAAAMVDDAAAAAEVEDDATDAAAAEVEDDATDAAAAEVEDDTTDASAAEVEDDATDPKENKCSVCLQIGHWHFFCPNKRRCPDYIKEVGPNYMLVCYHCACCRFNPDGTCVRCGFVSKRISVKICDTCGMAKRKSGPCPYEGVDLSLPYMTE